MSEHLFDSLTNRGVKFLSIPVVNCVLHSAFGKKSKRIKTQALVEFKLGNEIYEQVALIAPDLVVDMLIGVDFFDENKVHIDFHSKSFETRVGGVATSYKFYDDETAEQGCKALEDGECCVPADAVMNAESGIIGGGKIGRIDYDIDDSGCIVPADIVANQSLPEANCGSVGGRANPDSCLFNASRERDEQGLVKGTLANCSTAVLVNGLTTCLDAIQDHQSPHKSLANESMVTSEARDTPTLSLRSKVNEATNLNGTERHTAL